MGLAAIPAYFGAKKVASSVGSYLSPSTTQTTPPAAPAMPDQADATNAAIQSARKVALRNLMGRRGLQSTFLQPTQVGQGVMSTLLGSGTGK